MKSIGIISALVFANFLYAYFSNSVTYGMALERSYFQAAAVLITIYTY